MALSPLQQFQELINKSNHILITLKRDFTGDGVASALALSIFLTKMEKKWNIVCSDFVMAKEMAFLSGINEIQDKLTNLRQFIISLDLKDKKVDEFSYDVSNDKLKIYVIPQEGGFDEQDVKTDSAAYRFDCIITLDTPDLESLGDVYYNQPDFFFAVPIINIDHNLANENHGQLNLVETTKTSVAEIIYKLINEIDANLIDEEMATLLLAGMISKTQSFKTANIIPATLHAASDLIFKGADREKIINNFYRTKTLPVLKLWGRILARLQHDRHLKLVWSAIPHTDFVKSGAEEKDMRGVVEEMIANSQQAEIILLVYEKSNGKISGQLYSSPNYDCCYLLNNFDVSGSKNFVTFEIEGKNLQEVEAEVVNEIRNKLEK